LLGTTADSGFAESQKTAATGIDWEHPFQLPKIIELNAIAGRCR